MTVKHLVISGGGIYGLCALGALLALHARGVWRVEDVESVYGTSVGAIIGVVLCLQYDFEVLREYKWRYKAEWIVVCT